VIPAPQADASQLVDRRMALAREWDELVEQARRLDGFENFLKPLPLDTFLPAATDGPVVVINISQRRCDALIVTTTGVWVQELQNVTTASVADKTNEYLRVLQNVDSAVHELQAARERYDDGDQGLDSVRRYTEAKRRVQSAERGRDRMLTAILAWLWDVITDPVLTAVGFVSTPEPGQPWPRLWWCPTGLLTLLPLHAAGYHGEELSGTPARAVMDRVVSSYTPTLRALLEARRPLDPQPDDDQMLIVALPDTPDEIPLANVMRERDLLVSLFPGHHTLLEGAAASWETVRSELPHHRWVHFSCHGGQNLTDPSRGGLLLHDRLLATADISAGHHRGEFAFLSACMTATGGVTLPDEAITLAAAMHYTGYRHVIGTLWSVYDETAADIAEAVYADLMSSRRFEPARSAYALHVTIRRLRDVKYLSPSTWAPFTHTGPLLSQTCRQEVLVTVNDLPMNRGELLPYLEMTEDAYGPRAAESFTVEEPAAGTLVLRGPCPRCEALIEIPVVSSVFRLSRSIRGPLRRKTPSTAETGHVEPMMCTCQDGHPGRPEGYSGCGAYWTLTIPAQP
jgi:CHAT domain